jgi:hypothetical protein
MTTRASIFALTALAAVSAMALATTAASADGVRFLAQRPIFVPTAPATQVIENCNGDPRLGCAVHIEPTPSTQVIENCNGDPRLGCAVHIEPTPSTPVSMCPWRFRAPVRVEASVPYTVRLRMPLRFPTTAASYRRYRVY